MVGWDITDCLNPIYEEPVNKNKGCCMKGNFLDAAAIFVYVSGKGIKVV